MFRVYPSLHQLSPDSSTSSQSDASGSQIYLRRWLDDVSACQIVTVRSLVRTSAISVFQGILDSVLDHEVAR